MLTESDRLFLAAAIELAQRGMNSVTPNPAVGCLLVRDGVVLGRGWHMRAGEGHAEVNALADARASARTRGAPDAADQVARGATAYVSLEPCAFEGRTPACSRALINAGVARVVAAMTDPHPKVAGAGFAELRAAGISVDVVELPAAQELIAGFVSRITRQRPFVRLKVAASLDGRTAMASGESQWITGPDARADVQRWRARSCAVITGSGTVLADDPRLTVRDTALAVEGRIRQPLRVVCDGRGQIKADRALTGSATDTGSVVDAPTLLARTVPVSPVGSAEVIQLPAGKDGAGVSLPALLKLLAERQCNEVLVEAGPRLIGAFLASGLWDELLVYQAPRLLGSDARALATLPFTRMAEAIGATIADCTQIGADLRLRLRPAGYD